MNFLISAVPSSSTSIFERWDRTGSSKYQISMSWIFQSTLKSQDSHSTQAQSRSRAKVFRDAYAKTRWEASFKQFGARGNWMSTNDFVIPVNWNGYIEGDEDNAITQTIVINATKTSPTVVEATHIIPLFLLLVRNRFKIAAKREMRNTQKLNCTVGTRIAV